MDGPEDRCRPAAGSPGQEHLAPCWQLRPWRWHRLLLAVRDDFVCASGDIALRPRDLARVGLMYLNGGTWNGRTILSPGWIEASASTHIPPSGADYARSGAIGYSYGWWVMSSEYGRGAYAAWGWGGQRLIVVPDLDMVAVFTGGSYWDPPYLSPHGMMVGYVLPSIG